MIDPNSTDEVGGVFIAFEPSVYDGSQWDMQWLEFEGSEAEALASLGSGSTVFITSYTADHYGLGVGDSITLQTLEGRKPFEVTAVVYGRDLTGFSVQGSWSNALKYYGTNDADYIKINANPGYDLSIIESDIMERWGETYHLKVEPYEVWRDRLMSGIAETNSVANVMQLIGIVIVALAIINTLMMNIWERRRELGMLRAVGMTRRQLMGIITAEALGLGLLGGLIGTGLALLSLPTVTDGYTSLLELGTDIPSVFSAPSVAIAIGIAIMVPVAASLLPAWQGTRIDIAEAMRTE
jgi:putative ABC transport system permease protein